MLETKIVSLLSLIFKVTLFWSGYCLLLMLVDLILFYGGQVFILSDIAFLLPDVLISLLIAVFILSILAIQLLKED